MITISLKRSKLSDLSPTYFKRMLKSCLEILNHGKELDSDSPEN
jgi:hypothetical protein